MSAKGFSQPGEAFWYCGFVVFVTFEFERDIALVVVFFHYAGDSGVIQIEGVPEAATIISFGLHEDGLRGALVELVIRVFEEISGIEQDLEPG